MELLGHNLEAPVHIDCYANWKGRSCLILTLWGQQREFLENGPQRETKQGITAGALFKRSDKKNNNSSVLGFLLQPFNNLILMAILLHLILEVNQG